jgi:isoleucyl-tRNA synthetase
MAPFTPFFADYLYREAGGVLESVHLEDWPTAGKIDAALISEMEAARVVCSKGLEARMSAKINVRQPLASLSIKKGIADSLSREMIELVKDEVNVKAVTLGASIEKDVELDTMMTLALKEEGTLRELMRLIQDLRKAKGLNVGDRALLTVETDGAGRKLIDTNEAELKAACGISEVRFAAVAGESIMLGDTPFKLGL